jgi:ABC-type branched-subunit amino acid transport system substrate-binding protein
MKGSFHGTLRVLVICLWLFLLPASAHCAGEDIVIGMSAAFRGPTRGLGIELYRGAMAYIDHVNNTGGIDGRKIIVQAYDDGYNPIPAIENTISLIETDNVLLLFSYLGTPTITRVLPLL